MLNQEYNKSFYVYEDINSDFKEINNMSQQDTGIDISDMIDTIVQVKIRNSSLNWKECSTFFASQIIFDNNLRQKIIRWNNLIIARNSNSKLSTNLLFKKDLFINPLKDFSLI